MYKFKGFTQKANEAMNLSIDEASKMGHTYIGTEHLLLGLLCEQTGVAAVPMKSMIRSIRPRRLKSFLPRDIRGDKPNGT